MVAYIHQHKNELTALSGILIVSGFVFGGLGNESLQDTLDQIHNAALVAVGSKLKSLKFEIPDEFKEIMDMYQ